MSNIDDRQWDHNHPFPDQVFAWVKRLQREYYCLLFPLHEPSKDKMHVCNCIAWDPRHNLYRFWLCKSARPQWELTFPKLIPMKKKGDSDGRDR